MEKIDDSFCSSKMTNKKFKPLIFPLISDNCEFCKPFQGLDFRATYIDRWLEKISE